ncbi:uncharacterized protein B0P05DRAFT_547891 [Gilbertella persicaria]|uniref:uncharacterized protein n=1 Tax=Gilbertella persicaria TaxID=101096 RepID=UPI00221F7574|nr:uncharacterized protein B0P05DRAFT_547891 [Gilbertella persicaria]KAI8074263.1 hypothetical protein B0P05DRAFT_547891 [Gilbertella persicaria]
MPATELPLYRSFLKVLQKWPVDKVRPNRDLKQVLTKRIEETFQTEKINMVQVENEFKALEKLVNNEFKTKVRKKKRE